MRRFVFLLGALLIFSATAGGVIIEKIVAVVNGEPITLTELQERAIFIKNATGKDLPLKEVLRQVILEELQLQEAKKLGLDVDPDVVNSYIENFKKENGMTDEDFKKFLEERGITEKAYREEIRRKILINKLMNYEIKLRVAVPEEEVREYYEKHKEEFRLPEGAEVWMIFIPREEGKELAENIYAKILAGESFEELARRYSKGPHAEDGGRLGIVKKGDLVKEIDEFVFNTDKPLGFIERPEGYYIVKVKRYKERYIPFEQVKDKIKAKLLQEKFEKRYKSWLNELFEKATIKILM
ncbi:MAG: hypothetical protein GXO44_00295 [Deferribacteres bacterium]|nr:hypothetical protein [Deferribacteres bacterium]